MTPIKTFIDNVDLKQHKKLIEIGLSKIIDLFKQDVQEIDENQIKDILSSIIKGEQIYDQTIKLHRIAYLAARLIRQEILLDEKKIEQWLYDLMNDWFTYLFNRIYSYLDNFSERILIELCADYPLGDIEVFQAVADRILFNIARFNYSEAQYQNFLFNEKIHPLARILEFENHYRFEYAIFLIRCGYFAEEIAKFEGNPDYGLKIMEIFQLNNNNKRTPKSPDVVKHLKRLNYVRNAISHPERAGFRYLKREHKIKIMNYHPGKKTYTYQEIITLRELWNISYILTLFDRGFVSVALAFSVIKDSRKKK